MLKKYVFLISALHTYLEFFFQQPLQCIIGKDCKLIFMTDIITKKEKKIFMIINNTYRTTIGMYWVDGAYYIPTYVKLLC